MADHTLKADGFENCVIGHFDRCGKPTVIVYDYDRCCKRLMARDGMSYEEDVEYMEFNVVGAWVGEGTPAFMHRGILKQIEEMLDGTDLVTHEKPGSSYHMIQSKVSH